MSVNDENAIFPRASSTILASVRSEARHTIAVRDLDNARPSRALTGFPSCALGPEAN